MAYIRPEAKPQETPVADVSVCRLPPEKHTNVTPTSATTIANHLRRDTTSREINRENTATQTGAVYNRISPMAAPLYCIDMKNT
ncbi:putative uncharacterized protein [Desulfovibrio ferrophilus]|uniref:Uncharacterized protein n=1 Tax=Desulfovibrio ferrophilus TaxID=241368 RepID=A0A2Z6AZ08_9BACT|nr:putative uncharacterized protein [Desulfovibrio ferrophilus]